MKKRQLEKHLQSHGCEFLRHGGNHDIWWNPANDEQTAMPRHSEVKPGTVSRICKDLVVPIPMGR